MLSVSKFMIRATSLGRLVTGKRGSTVVTAVDQQADGCHRPNQQAVSLTELSTDEREELADLLEAEVARL